MKKSEIVVVYPKKYLDELRDEIEETKARISSGEQPVFDTLDALLASWRKADGIIGIARVEP
jgi:DTW domain-containing protein YfiP